MTRMGRRNSLRDELTASTVAASVSSDQVKEHRFTTHNFKKKLPAFFRDGQSPFKYYERIFELGAGSMGAVMKVEKRSSYLKGKPNKPKKNTLRSTINILKLKKGSPKPDEKKQKAFAMKRMIVNMISQEFIDEIRNEISIIRMMDHPNIVKLYEIFNLNSQIYLVMECCTGGDLWHRMPYTQEQAARIIKKLNSAIDHMHNDGIVHRDLKMENVLFESDDPNAEIKVIDFGLSYVCQPGEMMTAKVGSFYTMAPQVLAGSYNSQADMWAVGVLAYVLLSGGKPFESDSQEGVIDRIVHCRYDFDEEVWGYISEDAKSFISQLIEMNPEVRLTPRKASKHAWLQNLNKVSILDRAYTDSLHKSAKFESESSLLKKIALLIIARNASLGEINKLRLAFQEYDADNDGVITFDDFQATLKGFEYTDEQISLYFDKLDVYGNGHVYFTDFIAATLESEGKIKDDRIADAFNRIDEGKTGYISKGNLKEILGEDYNEGMVHRAIQALDLDEDGKLSFEEFKGAFADPMKFELYEVTDKSDKMDRVLNKGSTSKEAYTEAHVELKLK